MSSILNDVKKIVGGYPPECTAFDTELIILINANINILTQIGVGPSTGFSITGATETWEDWLPDMTNLQMVKDFIHIKVKLIFDPPTNSTAAAAMNEAAKEYISRLNIQEDL